MNNVKRRMNRVKRLGQGVLWRFCAVVLLAMASGGWAGAQDQSGQQYQGQNQKQDQGQKTAGESPASTTAAPQTKEETKITPRQAEELFHSVDEILEFDSKQTGLAVKKEVKRKLTSREEVVSLPHQEQRRQGYAAAAAIGAGAEEIWAAAARLRSGEIAGRVAARAGCGLLRSEDEDGALAGLGSDGRAGAGDGA